MSDTNPSLETTLLREVAVHYRGRPRRGPRPDATTRELFLLLDVARRDSLGGRQRSG